MPSTSPFASPTILVKKKKRLNATLYRLPKSEHSHKEGRAPTSPHQRHLRHPHWLQVLLRLGLGHGLPLNGSAPWRSRKTAFSTPFGLVQSNVMPFGLATAHATFMQLMTIVLSGMLYTTCLAYLDDIIVFDQNFIEMLGRLYTALIRFGQANLKLTPSECAFGKTSVNVLGRH